MGVHQIGMHRKLARAGRGLGRLDKELLAFLDAHRLRLDLRAHGASTNLGRFVPPEGLPLLQGSERDVRTALAGALNVGLQVGYASGDAEMEGLSPRQNPLSQIPPLVQGRSASQGWGGGGDWTMY